MWETIEIYKIEDNLNKDDSIRMGASFAEIIEDPGRHVADWYDNIP